MDIGIYQVKMAIEFLDVFCQNKGESKMKALGKFKKHAGAIDLFFREANLETDEENIRTQLYAIVCSI